jgi:hypothetical protein
MKTANSLELEDNDLGQHPAEAAMHAGLVPSQPGEQPSPSAASLEIFYDGREVYGGY